MRCEDAWTIPSWRGRRPDSASRYKQTIAESERLLGRGARDAIKTQQLNRA